ncbi:MAG: type IX secretion system protein PorQ [Bacteroidia bacterium]
MKKWSLILLAFLPIVALSQIGGRHVYDFLNLPPSARAASLGGVNISTYDHDLNWAFLNPALANDSMHQTISTSVANYLSDITYGYAGYSHTFDNVGSFHGGIQWLSYGKMIEADVYGNQTGRFSASDLAIVVGGARKIDNFSLGTNLKLVNSNVSRYRSHFALGLDMGGAYVSDNELFTAGMVFRNIGFNLTKWEAPDGVNTPLPFEIQIGISQRLKHMPLRFSLTTTNLQTPNLVYYDKDAPPQVDLSGDTIETHFPVVDNLFRHAVIGTEFLITKGFNIRAGYNHMRRQELRSLNRGGIAGFSFGVGIKIKMFRFDYALSSYHAVGPTHQFSLSSNIGGFKKK